MKVRHKRHLMSKAAGGSSAPAHVRRNGDGGEGPVERDEAGLESTSKAGGVTKPSLVSGNKNVVREAESTKSIGEVDGIYAPKRLDRKRRPGGIQGG